VSQQPLKALQLLSNQAGQRKSARHQRNSSDFCKKMKRTIGHWLSPVARLITKLPRKSVAGLLSELSHASTDVKEDYD